MNIIISVPHSGTRFLMQRLGVSNHAHTHWPWEQLWSKLAGAEPIVALRNPVDVWQSWYKRSGDRFPHTEFFLAWGVLHTLDCMMELDVICVDKQEDSRITDWSPVDAYVSKYPLPPVEDLRSLYGLPIVKRHYGSHCIDTSGLPTNVYVQEDRIKAGLKLNF